MVCVFAISNASSTPFVTAVESMFQVISEKYLFFDATALSLILCCLSLVFVGFAGLLIPSPVLAVALHPRLLILNILNLWAYLILPR